MKKLFAIFVMALLVGFTATAQRTITDTLQGNEVVNFTPMLDAKEVHILATQLGGTTDGTFVLQGSTDGTTFTNLQPTAGLLYYFPSDTSKLTGYTWTLTSGASLLILTEEGKGMPKYLRGVGDGTASDTTLITIKWSK